MGANDSQEKYMVMLDAILCEIQGLRRDLQDRDDRDEADYQRDREEETARKGIRVSAFAVDECPPKEPFGAAWERLRERWREIERLTAEAETADIIARIDAILQRANFSAMAAEWGGAEVDPGEDVQNEPILGDPDDALESYGFPEPLCDGRLHPVMAGVLSGHLHAARGQ